ncbi:hypothetical protein [Burkholderia cenocepacia]|uniref:hypothetical protein n=1 Tax=Burkholderia cenocepacia TaxID=95486 RepID=UPI00076180EC|nr:hypothetical protein [Burkholderia cenocepacia]KWU19036.1 hypothetical protein AS149_12375 [Burkholderia cenocepacia]
MKIVPGSVASQFLWIDSLGRERIDHEKAWEARRAEFMEIARAEGLNTEEHHTVRLFKDPATQARYKTHQAEWHARTFPAD